MYPSLKHVVTLLPASVGDTSLLCDDIHSMCPDTVPVIAQIEVLPHFCPPLLLTFSPIVRPLAVPWARSQVRHGAQEIITQLTIEWPSTDRSKGPTIMK